MRNMEVSSMKRTAAFIIIICIMLCGCGENVLSENSETIQNNNSEIVAPSEVVNSVDDSASTFESDIEYIETKEEYTEIMKDIYSEIKEAASTLGTEKTEVLFNKIPWGSNFEVAESKMKQIDGYTQSVIFKGVVFTTEYFLCGYSKNNHESEEFSDIGGITLTSFDNMNVAGYSVSDCRMCFVGILKDGENVLSDKDSMLYAAYYKIESNNTKNTKEDIKTKISSIYGEPDNTREIEPYENAQTTNEYIYWYGANNTVLVLSSDNSGRITISYVWLDGEELLNAALDNAEKNQSESQDGVYGNGDTSGL